MPVLDNEMAIRRRDENLATLQRLGDRGRAARKLPRTTQDLGEQARRIRCHVKDDADGRRKIGGQPTDHELERLDTPGGGADDDEIARNC
jgi:hypothetical protein